MLARDTILFSMTSTRAASCTGVRVRDQKSTIDGEEFVAITIGDMTIHATAKLLRDTRDEIDRWLGTPAAIRLAEREAPRSGPCPNPKCGGRLDIAGPRWSCTACSWHGDTYDLDLDVGAEPPAAAAADTEAVAAVTA